MPDYHQRLTDCVQYVSDCCKCVSAVVILLIFHIPGMVCDMNTDSNGSQPVPTQPRPDIQAVIYAAGTLTRWQIMSELSLGEQLAVFEIAERIGSSANLVTQHLAGMRQSGLVVKRRSRLYEIPKQYLPVPGQRIVDYGHCLLRLDQTQ